MSEQFSKPENQEAPSKETVIEDLIKNPEDLSPLHRFLDEREKKVKDSKDTLTLNVEIAKIYRDAGLTRCRN